MGGPGTGAAPELTRLQRDFQAYVLHGRGSALGDAVAAPPDGDAGSRLAVYRDGYALRLIEALRSDYPTIHAMIGEDRFDALAREYVRAIRSRHPNLRWYGAGFSRFLCARPDRREALVEMAAWEWAVGLAFDAADETIVDAKELGAVPADQWPEMVLTFHPSVRRLDLRTDAPGAWKRFQSGEPADPATLPSSIPWLVWRRELQVQYRPMEEEEAWALDTARTGENFANLCTGLLRWKDEASVSGAVVGFLHTWLRDALVAGISAG